MLWTDLCTQLWILRSLLRDRRYPVRYRVAVLRSRWSFYGIGNLRTSQDFKVLNFGVICIGLSVSIYAAIAVGVAVMVNPMPYQPSMVTSQNEVNDDGLPEGYYPFLESPKTDPPQVKLPPYVKSTKICPGTLGRRPGQPPPGPSVRRTLNNLCGDLNKGYVPVNPMFQNIHGTPYPFELLKNKTLQFFSRTLPILKSDETIPRIATIQGDPQYYLQQQQQFPTGNIKRTTQLQRIRRDATTSAENETIVSAAAIDRKMPNFKNIYDTFSNLTKRQSRKFCDNDKGIFCLLYKLIQGQMFRSLMAQKRQDPSPEYRISNDPPAMDGPPTPCPAKIEYATPVFARNYQGLWRYVVQIPYEGYFTQTVEVTKCTNTKCYYMEGGCLSSPRWVSLLVAEIFYPETFTPINRRPPAHRTPVVLNENLPPPVQEFHKYQPFLNKRAAVPDQKVQLSPNDTKNVHCDGVDEFGCFQVRLYFDWFLIPGSCKCWRPDYFSKYARWGREVKYEL